MKELLSNAHARSIRYLESLSDRPVQPTDDAVSRLSALDVAFPDEPVSPDDVLGRLDEFGSPATIASAGPRYFGFVTGGVLPVSLAANWLAGAWDQNAHFVVGSPTAAALENVTLSWIRDILELPGTWGGGFVTGTTMGNFSGLVAGRHAVLRRAGWDVEANGLFGAPEVRVVVGEEAHTTLLQALALAGFGRERVIKVPVDAQGCMKADAMPKLSGPAIVCLQAGNVNSGGFDPIPEFARKLGRAKKEVWIHVDGAFGLWAKASSKYSHLVDGLTEVDSIATDLHKWINVPYDAGLALYRDPDAARNALSITAAYLPKGKERQPCDYTPESSRRARGVEIWAALASMGRSGLADLIERNCRYAQRFANGLRDAGFEILNDVVLNQVLVSFGHATDAVINAVQREGTCWCSGTMWKGQAAMRISVSSWATTDDDVERSLAAIVRIASAARGL